MEPAAGSWHTDPSPIRRVATRANRAILFCASRHGNLRSNVFLSEFPIDFGSLFIGVGGNRWKHPRVPATSSASGFEGASASPAFHVPHHLFSPPRHKLA